MLLSFCEVVLCCDRCQVEVAVIEPGVFPVDELHFLVVKEDIFGIEVMVGEDKFSGLPVELPERMKRFGVSGLERFFESVGSGSQLDLVEFAQGGSQGTKFPGGEPALVFPFQKIRDHEVVFRIIVNGFGPEFSLVRPVLYPVLKGTVYLIGLKLSQQIACIFGDR